MHVSMPGVTSPGGRGGGFGTESFAYQRRVSTYETDSLNRFWLGKCER